MSVSVGDQYVNGSGDVLTVRKIAGGVVFFTDPHICPPMLEEEIDMLCTSGVWRKTLAMAVVKLPPKCTRCGTMNEFRDGPYTCWACREGANT
jgi:hypothetical protein